jgi:CDP-glucose 4,6-dehydratase
MLSALSSPYRGRRVLVTGHTGFKGSWLCEWLLSLGAEVTGLALDPATQPALYDQLNLSTRLHDHRGDVRDAALVLDVVKRTRPEFVFHLAAQPLVRLSYEQPIETYATNVMGTVHVLDAVRRVGAPCTVIVVTTDKCYENREWVHSYREEDPVGGYDPYSSSKGAAELVVSAYRRSYFSNPDSPIRLASARAGNVIGGGDWALDRIVPDCMRALQGGKSILVRNRHATRPWQHVLEPLSGYLWLGAKLAEGTYPSPALAGAFNFGPKLSSNRSVGDLVQEILKHWPGTVEDRSDPKAPHEAKLLNLATDKAHHLLGWRPVWDFERTIAETAHWYSASHKAPVAGPVQMTTDQLRRYIEDAAARNLPWADGGNS